MIVVRDDEGARLVDLPEKVRDFPDAELGLQLLRVAEQYPTGMPRAERVLWAARHLVQALDPVHRRDEDRETRIIATPIVTLYLMQGG